MHEPAENKDLKCRNKQLNEKKLTDLLTIKESQYPAETPKTQQKLQTVAALYKRFKNTFSESKKGFRGNKGRRVYDSL